MFFLLYFNLIVVTPAPILKNKGSMYLLKKTTEGAVAASRKEG